MSTPILPFAVWAPGTNQNSIPANDNSLRQQILNGLVIGVENDDPGGSVDGDIYIVGDTPAGAFATFDEFDLVILDSGTWYAFAPVEGIIVNIAGAANQWDGAAYVAVTTGGGGGSQNVTVITEGSAFTVEPGVHDGRNRYIRAGGDATFDNAEGYSAGEVYTIRATGTIELIGDGVTLIPPAGGTLDLTAGMAVTVIMTSSTAGDVIGQTVAA
jgi:hypothetical protein